MGEPSTKRTGGEEAVPVVNKADDAPMDPFRSADDGAVVNKASGYHSLAVCLSRSVRTP